MQRKSLNSKSRLAISTIHARAILTSPTAPGIFGEKSAQTRDYTTRHHHTPNKENECAIFSHVARTVDNVQRGWAGVSAGLKTGPPIDQKRTPTHLGNLVIIQPEGAYIHVQPYN
jgi:hypothetical protein